MTGDTFWAFALITAIPVAVILALTIDRWLPYFDRLFWHKIFPPSPQTTLGSMQQEYLDKYGVLPQDDLWQPSLPVSHFHPDQKHLQQLCHTLMSKFPGLKEPKVYVRSVLSFGEASHIAQAIGSDVIEFNELHLKRSEQDTINTMTHELIHCWMYCHDIPDDDAHGDKFEMACKLLNIPFHPSWRTKKKDADKKVDDDPLGIKDALDGLRGNR